MSNESTTSRFTLDGRFTYAAVSYGRHWNGWVTPVVTADELRRLVDVEGDHGRYFTLSFDERGVATLVEIDSPSDAEPNVLVPNGSGYYELDVLGWTFRLADDHNAPSA